MISALVSRVVTPNVRPLVGADRYGYRGLDVDFKNNGVPLLDRPLKLKTLNATYTRNSVKNVVQNGALVSLSANQFGTSYDPVSAQYGYVPEPAATNLATYSDGNAATYTVSNVSDGTAVPGFTNGLVFGDNSVQRSATKSISITSGTAYSISFFVIMDDGNAPVVGTTNSTGDFSITLNATIATTKLERLIGSNVYRVSASITAGATSSQAAGIIKYTGQSARTFRITGIQVETGLRATSYITTTGSTASRSADVLTVPLWVNNLKDSQDLSTASWTRTGCTATTSGTAPDGTATAQLVTITNTTTNILQAVKAPSSTVSLSCYVKAGNKTTHRLMCRNNSTTTDFTVGILTFATGGITGTGWSATDVGNGWFRCTFTQSTGITVGDNILMYSHITAQGWSVNDTFYTWGHQIEAGSIATTYRPTTSTLESAANANITGFSSAGYTLAVDQRMDRTLAASTGALEVSNGSITDRAVVYASGGILSLAAMTTNSVSQGTVSGAALGLTRKKYAGSFATNSIMAATAGVAGTPDTSATMSAGLLFLHIGAAYNGSIQYNGFIFRAQLITQALTQAQINGLTT